MSDNDNTSNLTVNLPLNSQEIIQDDEDTTPSNKSLKETSEHLNLLGKTSLRFSTNVQINERNVENILENVLQRCTEQLQNSDEESRKTKNDVMIIHPQQFSSIASSDDLFNNSSSKSLNCLQTSSLARQKYGMSEAAFKAFLLQNFPSDVPFSAHNSTALRELFNSRNALFKHTNDNSTQFTLQDIPSEGEVPADIFSRHAIRESSQIHISPSTVPPRPILGHPPIEGAPPTYSAVMRIGAAINNPRRLFSRRIEPRIEPSPPFIRPSPPPTYAEAQGHYYRPIVVDSDLIWGPDPMPAACQRCATYVITTVTNQRSNLTHYAALALCLCGCWPCCLLPYCMNSCKNTYHYCPQCNTYLGMYRPW